MNDVCTMSMTAVVVWMETVETRERLARAIEELGKAGLGFMAERAREGFYDGLLSPLARPGEALAQDLASLGLEELRQRAVAGEFENTREEIEAWRESEEGRGAREAVRRIDHGLRTTDDRRS